MRSTSFIAILILMVFSCQTIPVVYPALETEPVANRDDAADDPAIFVHPTDPSKHLIIGTDKQNGLMLYNTSGKQLRSYELGRINNVDLRREVAWNNGQITLLGGSNRTNNSIVFYSLDGQTQELRPLHEEEFISQLDEVYGFCLYQNQGIYAFVVGKDGQVEQWELRAKPDGQLAAEVVRTFDVGEQCEGMVADDELEVLYIGEENVGIWQYGANPDDGSVRKKIQLIRENKYLKADIEGLAIYYGPDQSGYLIASVQGNNSYALFDRRNDHQYLGSFRIKAAGAVDGVKQTDGIEVSSKAFNSQFPLGIFVVQDGKNSRENQNFKIVDWRQIAEVLQFRELTKPDE